MHRKLSSYQIKKVDRIIDENGSFGKRKESSPENPGPGFLKSGNYQFTLRPLLLSEYKYPGKFSNSMSFNFLLERLSDDERKLLITEQSSSKKKSNKPLQGLISRLSLPVNDQYESGKDKAGKFSLPWREYEIIDGNHKLYVFQNK